MSGRVRIGTSGWVYAHWRGLFYPTELPQTSWLRYYAERFDTVELNNSFYRQPTLEQFERWRRAVPMDFRYAVKLNRFITHIKRLKVDADTIARSYDTVAGLGPGLAAILVQLPPKFAFDAERLDAFCAAVARRRRRHAIEPRDASWLTDAAVEELRKRNLSLCFIDTPRWPTRLAITADFVYLRFHGPGALYSSPYDDAMLGEWAARIRGWRDDGRDVYAYFNNDVRAYAPRDAVRLRELVG
ncbi:MAG TPA: DUF72 domain-containing protein [Candidatus Limnocylindrales bacterium]|nr:DUF72 domain-containing protein [Candidatus Limnocylindrales bacterium]